MDQQAQDLVEHFGHCFCSILGHFGLLLGYAEGEIKNQLPSHPPFHVRRPTRPVLIFGANCSLSMEAKYEIPRPPPSQLPITEYERLEEYRTKCSSKEEEEGERGARPYANL